MLARKDKDFRTNDPLVSPLLPQPPGHLVGSVILGNFLTHDEHLDRIDYEF